MTKKPTADPGAVAAPALVQRLLLVESQPDHAVLVRDALSREIPECRVVFSDGEQEPSDADLRDLDAVLVSLDCAPRFARDLLVRLRALPGTPAVFALRGAACHWSDADRRALGAHRELDKREGNRFLDQLGDAVRAAVAATPGAPSPGAVRESDPDDPREEPIRPIEEAARRLAGRLSRRVALCGSLVELVRHELQREGVGGAAPEYADAVRTEIAELVRSVRSLERLLETRAGGRGSVRVGAGAFVALREEAWRAWHPGAGVTARADRDLPAVEADPWLLGRFLDAVVGAGAAASGAAPGRWSVVVTVRRDRGTTPRSSESAASGVRYRCALRPREGVAADTSAPPACRAAEAQSEWIRLGAAIAELSGGSFEAITHGGRSGEIASLQLPAAPPTLAGGRSVKPAQVLIVDDDESVRAALAALLAALGCRVVHAFSGEQAATLYESGCRYDLAIVDVTLGGIDGARTAARIRRADPNARILICSGSFSPEPIRRAFAAGALGVVRKPIGLHELREALELTLAQPVR